MGNSSLTNYAVSGNVPKGWQLITYTVKLSKWSQYISSPSQQAQSQTIPGHSAGASVSQGPLQEAVGMGPSCLEGRRVEQCEY